MAESSRWICKLSQEEVAALKNYGTLPDHKAHTHISRWKALELISGDLARSVGEEYGLRAIVEDESNMRVWKSRLSGGFNVRQLVRLVQG